MLAVTQQPDRVRRQERAVFQLVRSNSDNGALRIELWVLLIASRFIKSNMPYGRKRSGKFSKLVPRKKRKGQIRKNKLLLQIAVRELHNDLIWDVPECTRADGSILVSDWQLRKILPPEVRRMSNYYKVMCACITCVQMKMHQETYNRFKSKLLKKMRLSVESSGLGTRARKQNVEFYKRYENQCDDRVTLYQALACVHCKPVHENKGSFENLFTLDCAFGRCDNCPKFQVL